MAGLVPAISLRRALYTPKRDRRDKPGDDDVARSNAAMAETAIVTIAES
jgi:hypothetical protein